MSRPESVHAIGYVFEPHCANPEVAARSLERAMRSRGLQLSRVFRDEGRSEYRSSLDRPGLIEALIAGSRHRPSLLVVPDPGHLGPSPLGWPLTFVLAERLGVELRSADCASLEPDRPVATTAGSLVPALRRLVELDRALPIRAEMDRRGEERVLRSRRPPYGYQLAPDGRTMVPHPEEQKMIRRAVYLRAQGCTLREVGERLEEEGFRPREACRWHANTIRSIVSRASGSGGDEG